MKISPIETFHEKGNATFTDDNGWRLPVHFGDPSAEYHAVRSSAGWVDFADRLVLSFTGPDTADWLQGMLSNDVKVLSPGEGTQAAILNIQGKILADVRVFCTDESYLIDLWEPLKARVLEHLGRYLVADEVEIVDHSEDLTSVSIQGPQARMLLSKILGTHALPTSKLGHAAIQHDNSSLRIIAASHTGEEGFDLILEREQLLRLLTNEPDNSATIPWVGLAAQHTLRVEAGIPRYGVDMDEGTLLLETNLNDAVSFSKGCYLGQEVVERIHSRGHVNKELVGVRCDGQQVPKRDDVMESTDGPNIGLITSATFSPHLSCPVALGYIDREHAATDQTLVIRNNGTAISAAVTQLPFYERR